MSTRRKPGEVLPASPPTSPLGCRTTSTMLQQRRSFSSSTSDRRGRQQQQAFRPRTTSVWEVVFLVVLLILTCVNLYTYSERRERVRARNTPHGVPYPPPIALFPWPACLPGVPAALARVVISRRKYRCRSSCSLGPLCSTRHTLPYLIHIDPHHVGKFVCASDRSASSPARKGEGVDLRLDSDSPSRSDQKYPPRSAPYARQAQPITASSDFLQGARSRRQQSKPFASSARLVLMRAVVSRCCCCAFFVYEMIFGSKFDQARNGSTPGSREIAPHAGVFPFSVNCTAG